MSETIQYKQEILYEELEKLRFDKLITGNIDKENELVTEDLKIKITDQGCILYKWDISLYRKDSEFYVEISRVKGFDIADIKDAIDNIK